MFTDSIGVDDLAGMLSPHMQKPAWPGLDKPVVRRRARGYARQLGLWDSLPDGFIRQGMEYGMKLGGWRTMPRLFDPAETIPAIRHSFFKLAKTSGSYEKLLLAQRQQYYMMAAAATALWLEHPWADIDVLQDVMWTVCENEPLGGVVAVSAMGADLGTSTLASDMAEFLFLFGDRFDENVKARVARTIEERVLQPARDYRLDNWWLTCRHNWNLVLLSNLISSACYLFRDARTLAYYIHPLIENLKYGLEGFTADGGGTEGPDYWAYGFEHYLDAAIMLEHKTGGKLDLMRQNEKIERICRYPLAAHIEGPVRACWADSYHEFMPARVMFKINRYFHLPELFSLCERNRRGALLVDTFDNYRIWRTLTLYHDVKPRRVELGDAYLSDLGQAKMYAARSRSRVALAAVAGNNGVNHNHNDIGSFIFYKHGTCMLTDPGYPSYKMDNFGPARYRYIYNNSFGHSVPVVNGKGQSPGAEHVGFMQVHGLGSRGEKRVTIDMTRAYDEPTLRALKRELVLLPEGALRLTDAFQFSRKPRALREAFITYERATVIRGGRGVRIGSGRKKTVLHAGAEPGRFRVERLVEESKGGRGQGIITRISFVPKRLDREMTVDFTIT
jgi:hypothetical protein